MSTLETSFVLIKPDGVQRGLIGSVVERIERCGLRIIAMRMLVAKLETLEEHYIEHREKDFFPDLIHFMQDQTVVILAVEGADAVANIRKLVGATEPASAQPGTIRGDFCHMSYQRSNMNAYKVIANLIHAADSPESANRELNLWFSEDDLCYINNARCNQDFM